jgi:carboxypeptidase Taq
MHASTTPAALYAQYEAKMRKIADLKNAAAVLEWDQETFLPAKGAAARRRQLATLRSTAHGWFTDQQMEDILQGLAESDKLSEVERSNVALTLQDYQKQKKYTAAFVEELSLATSTCYQAWVEASRHNDYGRFEPALRHMVSLKRQEAELLGYQAHPYDALLDDFEKGATVAMLDRIFAEVKDALQQFLSPILATGGAEEHLLHQSFDKDRQWSFGMEVLQTMGFDFEAGRQDLSPHPFTTSFSSQDVRLTTRVDEQDFGNMTWSCIHEGGHGLYEQGLPASAYGLPAGEAASLAIHESQSRLWENNVGRGRAFWRYFYPVLQRYFPEAFGGVEEEKFYRAINRVGPSLIRTEADELTYHFHIMIRYTLEKSLIDGTLTTSDLRDAWQQMYRQYLGVEVPDDRRGVLQDVHWSHGSFGYFPTYSLGSFYAAQFYRAACRDIPDLDTQVSQGKLLGLLEWLRQHIHRHGRIYPAEVLCEKVTGEKLQFRYFMDYVRAKYGELYPA